MPRLSKKELDAFHERMISLYGLKDFFSKNPKLDRYFRNKIHRPLLRLLKSENLSTRDLKLCAKMYTDFKRFIAEASIPGKAVIDSKTMEILKQERIPNELVFNTLVGHRVRKISDNLHNLVASGIAAPVLDYYMITSPNEINFVFGSLANITLAASAYRIGKYYRGNPIGVKVYRYVKDKDTLERLADMIAHHAYALRRKVLLELEKTDPNLVRRVLDKEMPWRAKRINKEKEQ